MWCHTFADNSLHRKALKMYEKFIAKSMYAYLNNENLSENYIISIDKWNANARTDKLTTNEHHRESFFEGSMIFAILHFSVNLLS